MARGFQDVGRRTIAVLLMAAGVRDIIYSVEGPHMNAFWLPILHQSFIPGAILILIGVGMWNASNWSRVCCGILALLTWVALAVVEPVLSLFVLDSPPGVMPIPMMLTLAIPSGALALYCFLPATRKHFAEVREAKARASHDPEGDRLMTWIDL